MKNNLVLGIDPGTLKTGWGVITIEDGVLRHVDSGVIATKSKEELPERLVQIHRGLREKIESYQPGAVAVEDIFFARHPQGALKLGHARGVALLAAAQAMCPIFSYPPAQVKRAISGHGRAEKAQIARLVTVILRLREAPKEDQADALALAICHGAASGLLRPGRR